jgi:hypothetical protein
MHSTAFNTRISTLNSHLSTLTSLTFAALVPCHYHHIPTCSIRGSLPPTCQITRRPLGSITSPTHLLSSYDRNGSSSSSLSLSLSACPRRTWDLSIVQRSAKRKRTGRNEADVSGCPSLIGLQTGNYFVTCPREGSGGGRVLCKGTL